jgi:undecaprenyl-diphosphatase
MITILQAMILGLVQGLGEFLPISSSAHLVLVPWFFHFPDPGLAFDVMLHLGTAIALLAYFWKDLVRYFFAFINTLKRFKITTTDERLSWFIAVGSIPAMLFGILLEKKAETVFRNPLLIASALIVFSFILYAAEKYSSKKAGIDKLTWPNVILIGLAQVLALVPGVSRAGITIIAGLVCGLKREAAARFSFLLATPVIVGAGLYKLKDLFKHGNGFSWPLLTGFMVSAIVGFLAIAFLLNYLKKHSFKIFVWYRVLLGLIIIITYFLIIK